MGEVAQITKAPAPLRTGGSVMAIIPQDIDQVWRIAGMAVAGQMAPKSLVDGREFADAQAACAIAIMAGAELGLTPLMALRSYAVINGRPSLWGDGLKAVVRQSGKCEYIRTGSDQSLGWCEAKRSDTGETKRVEFTAEQAKAANLWSKKGPWSDGYRDVMMERRATNRCLNDLFADILGGIVDSQEALDSEPFEDRQPEPPIPPTADVPVTIEATASEAVTVDVNAYLIRLGEELSVADSADVVEEIFDAADPHTALAGNDTALDAAFKLKAEHIARVLLPMSPEPPAPPAGDLFPGDMPSKSRAD